MSCVSCSCASALRLAAAGRARRRRNWPWAAQRGERRRRASGPPGVPAWSSWRAVHAQLSACVAELAGCRVAVPSRQPQREPAGALCRGLPGRDGCRDGPARQPAPASDPARAAWAARRCGALTFGVLVDELQVLSHIPQHLGPHFLHRRVDLDVVPPLLHVVGQLAGVGLPNVRKLHEPLLLAERLLLRLVAALMSCAAEHRCATCSARSGHRFSAARPGRAPLEGCGQTRHGEGLALEERKEPRRILLLFSHQVKG